MLIAIYSRKSKWTGRGDSVENQISMCREYIEKNIEGWKDGEILVYEDEGFSGKNTKRPQFQKMMSDMKLRHFQYLVCYRLDRLGRNISDLARLIEKLSLEHTEFISIKERFDTTTPMGKAMLYFSGVLAQMEREQIAERVRDNMLMLARAGRWLGGNTPLGFRAEKKQICCGAEKSKSVFYLKVEEEEIRLVEFLFEKYLQEESLRKVENFLKESRILTRHQNEYTGSAVRDILTNPVYCTADKEGYEYFFQMGCKVCMDRGEADGSRGFISYGKTSSEKYKGADTDPQQWIIAPGKHRGIISGKDFVKTQKLLDRNRRVHGNTPCRNETALLAGRLFCICGYKMRPKHYGKNQEDSMKERRFSYRCPHRDATRGEKCRIQAVQGNSLDIQVSRRLLKLLEELLPIQTLYKDLEKNICRRREKQEEKGEAAFLEAEREKRRKEIGRLMALTARGEENTVFWEQLENEIKKRCEELEALEKKIQERKNEKERQFWDIQRFWSYEGIFSMLSIQEQREAIRLMITSAVWNGQEITMESFPQRYVALPQPEGPTIATNSPLKTENDI